MNSVVKVNFGTEQSPEVIDENVGINRLIDDKWIIICAKENIPAVNIDFNKSYKHLSPAEKIIVKECISHNCERKADGSLIANNDSTIQMIQTYSKSFFAEKRTRYPNLETIELSFEQICDCLIFKQDGSVRSYNTLRTVGNFWEYFYQSGVFAYPLVQQQLYNYAEGVSRDLGNSRKEFYSSSTYGVVPMGVAMPLLSYCTDIIDSDETKYLLGYHNYIRTIPESEYTIEHLKGVYKPRQKSWVSWGKHNFREHFNSDTETGRAMTHSVLKQYPVGTKVEDLPFQSWPFNYGSISTEHSHLHETKKVFFASLIAFMTLTGIRISEISSMKSDAIKKNGDRYDFETNIWKTHKGLPTVRYIAGYAAKIADVVGGLGLVPLENRDLFFEYTTLSQKGKSARFALPSKTGQTANNINDVIFDKFLDEHDDKLRQLCEKITPHMFRHTFAEFALRRFDGNVVELIRLHFRHHYGSFMTYEYTGDKQHESEWTKLVDDYLVELVERYISNGEELLGQMGKTVKAMADKYTHLSPQEAAQRVKEDFGSFTIKPHEYGFCMLRTATAAQAACYDKKLKLPKPEDATVNMCARCIHRLTLESQIEDVKRIGWVMQERAKAFNEIDAEFASLFSDEIAVARALMADIQNA